MLAKFASRFRRTSPRPKKRPRRLHMETCETRAMLATFVVSQDTDLGLQGELRWAVNAANANPGEDRIEFDVGNVALAQGELNITDSVVIDGGTPVPVLIDIAAAPSNRIFNIDDGTASTIDVTMINLQLRGGVTVGQGGAIPES